MGKEDQHHNAMARWLMCRDGVSIPGFGFVQLVLIFLFSRCSQLLYFSSQDPKHSVNQRAQESLYTLLGVELMAMSL